MNETTNSPKRRRWLSYSLRSLLLAFTLLALWLGVQTDRAIKQRRAVQIVERLGGVVQYHHQLTGDPKRQFDWKREPWAPRWLMNIFGDDYFVSAYEIFVNPAKPSEVEISDEEFAALCDVTSLRSLCVWRMPISDEAFAHVEKLPYLKTLRLDSRKLTDEGLQHVAGLRRLENLWLTATPMGPPILNETSRISDRGLTYLSRMSQLKSLDLGGARITDEGLEQLAQHPYPYLEELILSNTLVTDAGMAALAKMPGLRIVSLQSTVITDEGLKKLAGNQSLECIVLSDTKITDEGVAALRALPKLNHLRLQDTPISGAGLKGFTRLEFLFLNGTHVTDDEMKHIGQKPSLEVLNLEGTGITDEGLTELQNCMQLYSLGLNRTDITDAGVAKLASLVKVWDLSLEHTRVTDVGLSNLKALPLRFLRLEGTQVTKIGADKIRQTGAEKVYTDAKPDDSRQ